MGGVESLNTIYCYNGTLEGAEAVVYCRKGSERNGLEVLTCSSDGSWGRFLTTCEKIPTAAACK